LNSTPDSSLVALKKSKLVSELLELGKSHEHTRAIKIILFHPSFPVDVRHNVKIQREKLADWAAPNRKGKHEMFWLLVVVVFWGVILLNNCSTVEMK
jgi:hypothetical protein